MAATRAQKIRLGGFLIVSTGIIVATLFYLVGASMLEIRDEYYVMLQGSSGGLERGSQVRLNDIVVGRVEDVRLEPDDPGVVRVSLSLAHGTPITVDTVATPEMANITGSKRLAMRGGTRDSKRLDPGSEIRAVDSDLSLLATKVVNISDKLERVLDNLVQMTNPQNLDNVSKVIADVEGITARLNEIIASSQGHIEAIIVDAHEVVRHAGESMAKLENAITSMEAAVKGITSPHNLKQVAGVLDSANLVMRNAAQRTSDEELGQAIQAFSRLAADSNVLILRLRTDLQRVLKDLETSVENINEFTQILIDNPSVLISGRSEKDRELP